MEAIASMRHGEYKREIEDDDEDDEEETIELRRSASRLEPPRTDQGKQAAPRRPSTGRLRFPSSSSFVPAFSGAGRFSSSRSDQHHHSIQFSDEEFTRVPAYAAPAGPLMERLSTLVATGAGVLSSTSQMVKLDSMADSVAEAMSLLQNPFGTYGRKKDELGEYLVDPKLGDVKEQHTRLKLQAFWQLLLTGFEVVRYSAGKRAKTQVLWMDPAGKLYLDVSKKERHAAKSLFWADVTRIYKGSESECFTQSLSWREAKAKEYLSFSIHGRFGKEERVFAVQVLQSNVRNVLFENFEALLRMTKGDADGEFPSVAQKVIAQHYAATGDVLTLQQVEDILLREEDERFEDKETTGDRKHAMPSEGNESNADHDGGEHDGSSSDESDDDQRNILG